MNSELADKVIIVTGASGGLGSAIARKFAAEGARLVLHCNANRAKAEKLQSELPSIDSLIVKADLTKEADVKRLYAAAVKRFKRVDVPRHQRRLLGNPRCSLARNVTRNISAALWTASSPPRS